MAVLDKSATKRIVKKSDAHGDYEVWYDYQGISVKYTEKMDSFKKPMILLECADKKILPVRVEKSRDGSSMFSIETNGPKPASLAGRFTDLDTATMKVFDYFRSMKDLKKKA